MLFLRPSEETARIGFSRRVTIQRNAVCGKHQALQRRTEAVTEIFCLQTKVRFCPTKKIGHFAVRNQGKKEDHLSPGISCVLHYNKMIMPLFYL